MTRYSSWLYSVPGGECDNMNVVLKLIINLATGNNFGVEVKVLTEICKSRLAEAPATISGPGHHG